MEIESQVKEVCATVRTWKKERTAAFLNNIFDSISHLNKARGLTY